MIRKPAFVFSSLAVIAALSAPALAHVSVQGPAFAGERKVLTFGVGHGCEGADTVSVEIAIPEEVTSVRAVPSAWGEATLVTSDAELVTAVRWSKSDARDADDHYYQLAIRIAVPDMPFTTLYFPATQVCRAADGTETTVEWAALPGDEPAEGEELLESPTLHIMPKRFGGWNKYTVPAKIEDLSIFDDALIVWAGDDAYSSNPATVQMIEDTEGVELLTEIAAGTEIWVKY